MLGVTRKEGEEKGERERRGIEGEEDRERKGEREEERE